MYGRKKWLTPLGTNNYEKLKRDKYFPLVLFRDEWKKLPAPRAPHKWDETKTKVRISVTRTGFFSLVTTLQVCLTHPAKMGICGGLGRGPQPPENPYQPPPPPSPPHNCCLVPSTRTTPNRRCFSNEYWGKKDHQNHQKWSSTALRLLQEYSTKWASGAQTLFAVGGREANIYI